MEIGPTYEIHARRGDTHNLRIQVTDKVSGDPVPLVDGDMLRLTVREFAGSDTHILLKTVTEFPADGMARIQFAPDETADLAPRRYVYDVEVIKDGGYVQTVVPPDDRDPLPAFNITEDVTR